MKYSDHEGQFKIFSDFGDFGDSATQFCARISILPFGLHMQMEKW